MMQRTYLDWNATAPLLPEVKAAMIRALDEAHGNASSVHREGQAARSIVERARRAVARAVGAAPQAVVLTGGATEGNNQTLRAHARYTQGAHIACSAVEHPSVLEVVRALGDAGEARVTVLPVDRQGRLVMEAVQAALDDGVTLLSVMWANNEVGNVYDVRALAALAHTHGALLHVDATQALGRLSVRFDEAQIDLMTLSAHKMGGPKGVGAIVVREGVVLEATLAGGHQERGRRPGTENVPALAGLEAAARAVTAQLPAWIDDLGKKRALLLDTLTQEGVPFEVRGDPEAHLQNTLNLAFGEVDGEDLLLALDLEGLSLSSGSACTAGSIEPSHVLLAMGYDPRTARQSVRLSFGPTTSPDALTAAAARIAQTVRRLMALTHTP